MKVLIFEYITGGGFNKNELPMPLLREGRLMLQALLENFSVLNGLEISLMLDQRLTGMIDTFGFNTIYINSSQDTEAQFRWLAQTNEVIWPIVPEFDGLLAKYCQIVSGLGKALLTSPAHAVEVTGNKLTTYQQLVNHSIATVPTRLFTQDCYAPGEWMVKAVDGVGCADSYFINNEQDFASIPQLAGKYIIQPHLQGKKTSLSCLYKQGRAWLLCVNEQHFNIIGCQYQLAAITVNCQTELVCYCDLAGQIARAFPDLWGYVGVDLIETAERVLVLEINPRLTTSFIGIQTALGINVAAAVLQLQKGDPQFQEKTNQSVTLKIMHDDDL